MTDAAGRWEAEMRRADAGFALAKSAGPTHRARMKAPHALAIFLASAALAPAAETAYSALRVVGKNEGPETLNRVLELRGRAGAPHPAVWKVVIDDPRARGGVREIEVQRNRIIGQRSPTSRQAGSPMNFNQLNLDSEGAFTVANQEAQKAGVPFDRVDYLLKSGTGGGAPVWELELFDAQRGRTGSISIGAESGAILRRQLESSRGGAADDRAFLDERNDPRGGGYGNGRNLEDRDRESERDGRTSVTLPNILDRVGRHFQKRGRQLENFFTGR